MERPDWLNIVVLVIGLVLGPVLIVRAEQLAARSPARRPTPARVWRLVSVALVLGGAGQLLSAGRNLPLEGWSL